MSHHDKCSETPGDVRQPDEGTNIAQFPAKEEGEESEFLVDIDTHHSVLVVATDVDEAIAKVLSGEDDMNQTTVAHDVHVCVHSGISDNECDHEEGAE